MTLCLLFKLQNVVQCKRKFKQMSYTPDNPGTYENAVVHETVAGKWSVSQNGKGSEPTPLTTNFDRSQRVSTSLSMTNYGAVQNGRYSMNDPLPSPRL
jgi:hypothetical protein